MPGALNRLHRSMPYRPATRIESDCIMVKIVLRGRQGPLSVTLLLSVAASLVPPAPGLADPPTAGRPPVVVDWRTGLAIHGIDPVAYFSEKKAVPGQEAWEWNYAGAVWRFSNEGNRAVFAAHPEIYMPRFGGNDPIALARGVTLNGNPWIWVVFGDRLYLFHTPEARAAFLADPAGAIARAEAAVARAAAGLAR